MEVNNCTCKNKKKAKSVVFEVFSDYCSSTSIHGIGYLGAQDKNIFEKIWWIIVFILSLTACIFLIRQTWIKWNESPVVVAFSTEQIPVWEVPFPAVTICPLRKVRDFYYEQLIDYKNKTLITRGEKFVKAHKKIWDVEQICNLQSIFVDDWNSPSEYTDEDIIANIKNVSTSMLSTIMKHTFKSSSENGPGSRFAEQITSEGLCFTFNALGKKDMYTNEVKRNITLIDHERNSTGWTIEEGYEIDHDEAYPWRTAGEGVTAGLIIQAFSDWFNKDYVCNEPVTGFKIIIHNPADAPKVKDQYILAPPNKQVTIAVNPKVITTSEGLKNIAPEVRKCYFCDEKKLRFYKIYTQNNCKTECLVNVTKAWCSCVPFYLPQDNFTKVCGRGKSDCVVKAREVLLNYENNAKKNYMADNGKNNETFQIFSKCSCLPFCASLDYEYQISSSDYRLTDMETSDQKNNCRGDVTHLKIFFQDSQFMALHRSELYGQTDFVANIGGLLGLFMGFSFLSLLEIVYFLTLRIWCKLHNKNNIEIG